MKIALLCFGFKEIEKENALSYFIKLNKFDYELLEKHLTTQNGECDILFSSYLENKILINSPTTMYLSENVIAEFDVFQLPDEIDVNNEELKNTIYENIINSRYLNIWSIKHGIKAELFLIDLDLENLEKYEKDDEKIKTIVDLQSLYTKEQIKLMTDQTIKEEIKTE